MKKEKENIEVLETNKKSNKGIIILLIIIILGLVGYICYDRGTFDNLLGKDAKPSQEENINNNNNAFGDFFKINQNLGNSNGNNNNIKNPLDMIDDNKVLSKYSSCASL